MHFLHSIIFSDFQLGEHGLGRGLEGARDVGPVSFQCQKSSRYKMRLRFSPTQIEHWASSYPIGKLEPSLLALAPAIKQSGFLTKDQLHGLAQWKSARSAPRTLLNSEKYVREVTLFALSTNDERARIQSLTILDGVLWPTASVILHLFHPEPYPLLDFRALWSVGEKVPAQYSFEFWLRYVQYCRKLAEKQGVSMRVLDRALWQYSSVNQPGEA